MNLVYVSYARTPESGKLVDKLEKAFLSQGVELQRDVSSMSYGDSISAFMKQMGQGEAIVVVLSDDYLRSEYCLFELLEASRHSEFAERVFPLVMTGTPIIDAADSLRYYGHWEAKEQELIAKRNELPRQDHLENINRTIDLYHDIRSAFDWVKGVLTDKNVLTQALLE